MCGPSGASGTQQLLATKMARSLGTMEEFDVGRANWSSYSARLDHFISANDVNDGRKVATLLTVVGSETYQFLENLVFPDKPLQTTYEVLKAVLSAHLSPKPLLTAQRYRFHKRDQKEGETAIQFIAELRSLARPVSLIMLCSLRYVTGSCVVYERQRR